MEQRGIFFIWVICLTIPSILLNSCKKEDEPPLDVVPSISLSSMHPREVQQFKDSIVFEIAYEDGDGDVGFQHPDSFSLTIRDARVSQPDWFFVSPRAPLGEEVAISGTFSFTLRNTFLLGNGGNEQTTYIIRLKDRAGHWSNEVTSPPVIIKP